VEVFLSNLAMQFPRRVAYGLYRMVAPAVKLFIL